MKREQLLLYGITDRSYLKGISLNDAVEKALKGGATIIQLREKELDEDALRLEIPPLLALCRKYGVPFILDDHVELALELGCDGVHVGQNDMPAGKARRILGAGRILGVTAKTVSQARAAEDAGADYLGSGAMFITSTKPEALPMSPETLSEITHSVDIPVVAIGGITLENLPSLKGLGVSGFAVSEALFDSDDIQSAAAALKKAAEISARLDLT